MASREQGSLFFRSEYSERLSIHPPEQSTGTYRQYQVDSVGLKREECKKFGGKSDRGVMEELEECGKG